MKNIDHSAVRIRDGFWKQKQELVRNVTAKAVYDRFSDTGRFAALKCSWKPGDEPEPHIFWDSDVAKWLEGVAYLLQEAPAPELYSLARAAIDDILSSQEADTGYYNCYYLTHPDAPRLTQRGNHELYCLGHLIEGAVAWYAATGERDFMDAMAKYADYVEKCFKTERTAGFVTPGHPELELALVRLANATGERRYMELAKFFIDEHGVDKREGFGALCDWANDIYNMDEKPLRERDTIDGHSVRAFYLLSAVADIAAEYDDGELAAAARRCFDNAAFKRMYITGGFGSSHIGEAFTGDHDLPNRTAYTETCASIAMAFFARRMQKLETDSAFADAIERVLYNGALSGLSLDGRAFFYENPLEIDPDFNHVEPATKIPPHYPITQRLEVFGCSCCPPNVVRLLPAVGDYLYGLDGDTVYVHQYADSEAAFDGVSITQTTRYPADGAVKIRVFGAKKLALRIPGWCESFTLSVPYTMYRGYAVADVTDGAEIELLLAMPVVTMAAHTRVHADAGRIAVMRGPVVYCMEGVDNGKELFSLKLAADAVFEEEDSSVCFAENAPLLPVLKTTVTRRSAPDALYSPARAVVSEDVPARFIPYFAFANRGETEMQVWVLEK
ncbi:MAG: glycoside hydrolase family 127 protein [Oscillospiraceae bacterium]|nr:glycoside hydrolase family 127 protein [Oscillospiraceae bacterium]